MTDRIVNPNMITLAREALGWTQTELAHRLNVPQSKVSKIESGLIGVTPDMLATLSQALKFPENFFYQTFQVFPAGMHLYLFRKHKTLLSKDLSKIVAWMNLYRSHIKYLLQAAEIEYKPVPHYDIDDFGSVQNIARAVRQYVNAPIGPIQSVTSVLEDLGVVVVPFDPGTRKFQGASMLTEKPNYVVIANSTMPGAAWRWTLVHELGHMVMHHMPSSNMEAEADDFAAEFLMPIREVGPYFRDPEFPSIEKLATLKKIYNVSMFAILVHAKRSGFITPDQYRSCITKMGKVGITRLQEPPELDTPREIPSLLNEILEFHAEELNYTAQQVSDLILFDVHRFLDRYRFSGRTLRVVENVG
jgi:Zn-dependent peptidase ImmA (M78 family)/transcriptional regulator with XRE-family HTH domain